MKILSTESVLSKCTLLFLAGSEPRSLFWVLKNGFFSVLTLSTLPLHMGLWGSGLQVPGMPSKAPP